MSWITSKTTLWFIIFVCISALVAAFVGEYVFDLNPCTLCLYQRYAYAATILIATWGLLCNKSTLSISFSGMSFLVNTGIAFYQVLVEKKLVPLPKVCQAPRIIATDFEAFKSSLLAQAHVPCDQVPWELFGISMAGYNGILTLLMGLGCLLIGAVIGGQGLAKS